MRDFSEDLGDVARRVGDARGYLRVEEARTRLTELEEQASAPDLWNDSEHARKVTSELASVRDDVQLIDDLDQRVSDLETLYELAGTTTPQGSIQLDLSRVDDSALASIASARASAEATLAADSFFWMKYPMPRPMASAGRARSTDKTGIR